MSILCEWKHPGCKNATKDQNHNILCHALTDCDFPNRKDCPFYKKNLRYVPDKYDIYAEGLAESIRRKKANGS